MESSPDILVSWSRFSLNVFHGFCSAAELSKGYRKPRFRKTELGVEKAGKRLNLR